jgi:hypothetical protein
MSVRIVLAFIAASACFGVGTANANGKVVVSVKDTYKASYSYQSKSDDRKGGKDDDRNGKDDRKGGKDDRNDRDDRYGKDDKDRDHHFPRPHNPRPPSRC